VPRAREEASFFLCTRQKLSAAKSSFRGHAASHASAQINVTDTKPRTRRERCARKKFWGSGSISMLLMHMSDFEARRGNAGAEKSNSVSASEFWGALGDARCASALLLFTQKNLETSTLTLAC
jgi:hypothetical protein